MATTSSKRTSPASPTEVRERGASLLYRMRGAGIWQYNRWFIDKEPKWKGDASLQSRIIMLLNGRGHLTDAELLTKCEALADRFLGKAAA